MWNERTNYKFIYTQEISFQEMSVLIAFTAQTP